MGNVHYYLLDVDPAVDYLESVAEQLSVRDRAALKLSAPTLVAQHIQYIVDCTHLSIEQNLAQFLPSELASAHGQCIHDLLLKQIAPIVDEHREADHIELIIANDQTYLLQVVKNAIRPLREYRDYCSDEYLHAIHASE